MPRFPYFAHTGKLLFQTQSPYGPVMVRENKDYRWLYFGGEGIQSAMYRKAPSETVFAYLRALQCFDAFIDAPKHLLILGLGGGGLVRGIMATHQYTSIDAVELNPVVIDVAERFFELPHSDRLQIYNQSAQDYLKVTHKNFDVILTDIFLSDDTPPTLTAHTFYEYAKMRLHPNGLFAINLIAGDISELAPILKTIRSVF